MIPDKRMPGADSPDIHWWDWSTQIEEVMQGLNNLVKAGKGMSNRAKHQHGTYADSRA